MVSYSLPVIAKCEAIAHRKMENGYKFVSGQKNAGWGSWFPSLRPATPRTKSSPFTPLSKDRSFGTPSPWGSRQSIGLVTQLHLSAWAACPNEPILGGIRCYYWCMEEL